MTALRDGILKIQTLAANGLPAPITTLPAVEVAMRQMGANLGELEGREELLTFLKKCREKGVSNLSKQQINRVLRGGPAFTEYLSFALEVAQKADLDPRPTSDRAVIEGYLLNYPEDEDALKHLGALAKKAANRRPQDWYKRSEAFALFDPPHGVRNVSKRIIEGDGPDPYAIIQDAGLGHSLFITRFGRTVFREACLKVSLISGTQAASAQNTLLDLLQLQDEFNDWEYITLALLKPWVSQVVDPDHRKLVTNFLLAKLGDPRLDRGSWSPIKEKISALVGSVQASDDIVGVLVRWLSEASMRIFFEAILEATDRPDMWRQRAKFWLSYLDAGVISEAWPALGPRAKSHIEEYAKRKGEKLGYGLIRELDSDRKGSSALIMQIGDTRIAEWSDNGMCRFWNADDEAAPQFRRRSYDNRALRTMKERDGFEAHIHNQGWPSRFARVILRRTGVAKPNN